MPKYTTSFSNKKTRQFTRRRGNAGYARPTTRGRQGLGTLPGSRKNVRGRRGGAYLKRTGGGYNKKTGLARYSGNERAPMALVIVGCAAVLFVAVLIWYMNRGVSITLNDEKVSVRIDSTVEKLISDQDLDETTKAGNLLAVDDTVLKKRGGKRYTITLNGEPLSEDDISTTKLQGGETLTIENGTDVYEEHDVQATEIQPTLTVNGSGAIQYVKTWGIPGRSEVWVGKESGKTQDRGVVQEVQNCVVSRTSASPSKKKKVVALTFDEGPSQGTQEILNVLKEKGVKATFFLQGNKLESNAAAAKAIADAGHEIGSNAFDDTDLTSLSTEELRSELTQGFEAIKSATGVETALLRAPYGTFSEKDWSLAADLVSAVVTWNLDSGDWLLKGADTVVSTVVGGTSNGNIILLSDNDATCKQTAEALPQIIDKLSEEGYSFATISELVASDEDLSEELQQVTTLSMPQDAVLPQLSVETQTDEEE